MPKTYKFYLKIILKTVSYYFLFLLFLSCKNHSEETMVLIDLEQEITLNYTDLFEDLKIIELDNDSDVLVSEVNDVLITEERIIILDKRLSEAIHFYDMNGKLINSIKADKGPEVFTSPSEFVLINRDTEVLVSDAMSFITYYYDLDGNYLRQVNTNEFGISSIANFSEDIYAVSIYQDDWKKKIEIRKSQDLSFQKFVDIEDELEFKMIAGHSSSIFKNSHNDHVYFTQKFHPKIIEIKNGQIENSYFFKFSNSNFDYLKDETYQMIDVYKTIQQKKLNALTGNLVASSQYIFANFISSKDQFNRTFLFDTKSRKSFVLEGLTNDMDIVMKSSRSLLSYPVRNKYLAYSYYPSDIAYALESFDEKTSNKHTKRIQSLDLKNDANPVLFIYTIKDDLKLDLD